MCRVRAHVLALFLFGLATTAQADPGRELSEGNALKQVDACEPALAHYDAAMAESAPGDGLWEAAAYNRGVCLEMLERWDDAVATYNGIVRRSPSRPAVDDAIFRRGMTRAAAGDRRARADFCRARRRVEDLAARRRIEIQLGMLDVAAGRQRKAVDRLGPAVEHLRRIVPDEPPEGWYLAQALVGLGDLHRIEATKPLPKGSLARVTEDLGERAEGLATAQGFYVEAAQQQHPTWTAAATLKLGDGYRQLAERLRAVAEQPGRMSAIEVAGLRAWIDGQVPGLERKARDAFRICADVFTETGLDDDSTKRCREDLK